MAAGPFESVEAVGSLLDTAPDAFVSIGEGGRILAWNRAAERTFGWSSVEVIGCSMAELIIPERLRSAHFDGLARFRDSGEGTILDRRIELPALHREGFEFPVEATISPMVIGNRVVFNAFLHDISQRRRAEAELRRLAAVVEASQDAIFSASPEGIVESWNKGAERLYGYSAQEMIGSSLARLSPDGRFDAGAEENRALREGQPVSLEIRERRKDGTLVDVAVTRSPLRDEHGEIVGLAVVVRDVTERNRAGERLAEAHSRFAGAFAAASMGMALVAPDGRYLAVNPSLSALVGRDADELLAMSFQELTYPEDVAADLEHLERALGGDCDSFQLSKRYVLPGGGIVWALVTVTLVRDSGGQPLYFVAQMQDITDRMTTQAELHRYAAQLQALSDRDPLTGLSNGRAFDVALEDELRLHAATGTLCSAVLATVGGEDSVLPAAAEALAGASREADPVAHLGGGEFALLLPGGDESTAAAVARRASDALAGFGCVACVHATVREGEDKDALLERLREPRDARREAPAVRHALALPPGVERLLELARRQLGMPVSFLTRLEGEDYVFTRFAGNHERFGVAEGDGIPLAGTHCQRMLDGRIGSLVRDLSAEPETRELDVTRVLGLRAYAGVPVRLRSGELFGTLCCVDTEPRPELTERHAELLRFLSDLTAELIDDAAEQRLARRAETSATGVRTLLGALQARDFYTSEHSKEVVALASSVARRLGLDDDETRDIEQVALLHDLGKVGIPDTILQKQGPLDAQERQLMRQHPIVGERIIAGTPGLSHLAAAVRAEHERWDGAGYPDGLIGEAIPLPSRITLACDAVHAMTSNRPYRPAITLDQARAELRSCAGSQFDPRVVDALLAELGARRESAPPPAGRAPTMLGARRDRGDVLGATPSPGRRSPR